MRLELEPPSADLTSTVPPGLRTQQAGRVVAVLDGDAHLHVWEPNAGADRLDVSFTDALALVVDMGLDAATPRSPHWTDSAKWVTLIVSLDLGADGVIMVDGNRISETAAVNLAAAGFVRLVGGTVDELKHPVPDELSPDAAEQRPEPDSSDPTGPAVQPDASPGG